MNKQGQDVVLIAPLYVRLIMWPEQNSVDRILMSIGDVAAGGLGVLKLGR